MGKIRIAISGIGAVGGYYGGLLANQYKYSEAIDVFFIARGKNLEYIKKHGLRIKVAGVSYQCVIPTLATDNPAEIGPVDFLFCCTKSYDLEENIEQLRPAIGPDTVVIPLLNGIDITRRIEKVLPDTEIWKGCAYIVSRLQEPGLVEKFYGKEKLMFGSTKGNKEKQKQLLYILTEAKINAFNPEDIDICIWQKFFLISTAATITSYFNQTIGEVLEQHRDLFLLLIMELKSITDALAIPIPADIVKNTLDAQKSMPSSLTTSMHSDFKCGKQTELETLTGYVIRIADSMKIDIPTYRFMYNGLTIFPYPDTNKDNRTKI